MGAVGKCVIGKVRKQNEDSIYVSDNAELNFDYYIVADGMGGHNAGEVASQAAIKYFNEFIQSECVINEPADMLDAFIDAVVISNQKVFEMAQADESYSGMGTTFTAAAVSEDKLYGVHIGDSRVYVFDKKDGLNQITKDHSFVMEMVRMGKLTLEEAKVHPKRNVITKAIGIENIMPADTFIETLNKDSIILICSDGLTAMVDDKEIEKVLRKRTGLDRKADLLVELANKNGGNDNISVILADRRVDK